MYLMPHTSYTHDAYTILRHYLYTPVLIHYTTLCSPTTLYPIPLAIPLFTGDLSGDRGRAAVKVERVRVRM